MTISKHPHGLSSFGIPIIGAGNIVTTGDVFFVHHNGSNSYSGEDPTQPFADIDYAIGKATASTGDIIIVMPGHAETASNTAGIVCDKIGLRIIGLGVGRNRPAITAGATGAIDAFTISAASTSLENLRIIGGTSGTTALVNVAAADFSAVNCIFEHTAVPLTAVTIAAGGLRPTFQSCTFLGTEAGPDNGIVIEAAAVSDFTVKDCDFRYNMSAGLDAAGIASAFTHKGVLISGCRFLSMDLCAIDFNSSATGLIEHCSATLTSSASVAEVMDVGDVCCVDTYVVGFSTTGKAGTLIPATSIAA